MFLKRGDTGKEVEEVQEALLLLGFISGKPDSIFGPKTENAIIDFQKKNKIITDGIIGPSTINEINIALKTIGRKTLHTFKPAKIKDTQKKLRWVKCRADVFSGRGGYSNLTLRADTAESYNNLRDDVIALCTMLVGHLILHYQPECRMLVLTHL
jgi:peptidoglycan hydrolase-like protein with peptidoglycan-binding domain